jgi:hypothetical protein
MSYALPLSGTAAREMFDMNDLVLIGSGDVVPLDLNETLRAAKRTFPKVPCARRLNYIVLRADDRLQLISVGRRGGWKVMWNFGPYQMPTKFRPQQKVG